MRYIVAVLGVGFAEQLTHGRTELITLRIKGHAGISIAVTLQQSLILEDVTFT